MKTYSGIDVSEHNGSINWKLVKNHIDFAMLRAGYGSSSTDSCFKTNATMCSNLKIPFGVYWFSYALNPEMAKKEAQRCLSVIRSYTISCPVAFDFEEDSLAYAVKKGVKLSAKDVASIADAFLTEVKNAGYPVLLYTNLNMWEQGLGKIGSAYPIWCAHWGATKPGLYCDMWQDGNTGRIEGISTPVDTDISYVKYAITEEVGNKNDKLNACFKKYGEFYEALAGEIIDGKYGNGEDRIKKLLEEHRDPAYAQEIVNILLS